MKRKIAMIFDFDETLTDDSSTELLRAEGIDAEVFWKSKLPRLVDEGFDPTEAYLMLLVKELKRRQRINALKSENLRRLGARLTFHPGVLDMFDKLRQVTPAGWTTQFFVISGGLQEIISGSAVSRKLADFWGCTFHWDSDLGLPYPKNVVSFTEKTKFIFQINKGLIGAKYKNKPYEVNEYMEPVVRQIPLENMIYIGDGLTDVPCFSVLGGSKKGHSIVVYNKSKTRREGLQGAIKLARLGRALGPFRADYRDGTSLKDLLEERIVEISEQVLK